MAERTKQDILRAYNTLIKKNNMDKITVEMLISEAGISKATFYRYFKDKYDVMNYNYKLLLDNVTSPKISSNFEDLYEHLFQYGAKNWKFLSHAFETLGRNSFCDYITSYSLEFVDKITRMNRNGEGLSETERLQCDVFSMGVSTMYRNWIFDQYQISSKEAAKALYDIMPSTLRDLWWVE